MSTKPSRTPAQIEASQKNGAKSKGPVTEEGKEISKLNALKTGQYASFDTLLPSEDQERFQTFRDDQYEIYDPANKEEAQLVESLVTDGWRKMRMIAIDRDRHVPDQNNATATRRFLSGIDTFVKMKRYEDSLTRSITRTKKELKEIQKERIQNEQNEPKTFQSEESQLAIDYILALLESGELNTTIIDLLENYIEEVEVKERTQDSKTSSTWIKRFNPAFRYTKSLLTALDTYGIIPSRLQLDEEPRNEPKNQRAS